MKKPNLAIDATYSFAKTHYRDRQSVDGRTLLEHCKNVAILAEKISVRLYEDVRGEFLPPDSKDSIAAIVHTALLHHAINIGDCPFEKIVDVTNVQIAAMVADISRDFRLVETKRDMEFRGRVSQSPVGAQIVVLSDIICCGREMISAAQQDGKDAIPRCKKLLTQLDADLLSLHVVSKYPVLQQYSSSARAILRNVSQQFKDIKAKAKMEKFVSRMTANVQKNKAAKKKICDDTDAVISSNKDTQNETRKSAT